MKTKIKKPIITYHQNGNISYEEYFFNKKLHRIDGPAMISYNENGSKSCESYFLNGKRHRIAGPAYIWFNIDGSERIVQYYENGFLHRVDGPAFMQFYPKNIKSFYLKGKHISAASDNEFKKIVKFLAFK